MLNWDKDCHYVTPAHSKASEKLVTQRLGLGDGAQAPVVHLLGIELHSALGELEPLLHNGGELPDPASLLTYTPPIHQNSAPQDRH
jgi:hypothetical protein